MIANHIHDALAQVRRMQELILEKRHFRGYSGKARIASGCVAIAGAAVLHSTLVPATPAAHLLGWSAVLVAGLLLNYVALLYWFLFDPDVRGNPIMLKPAVDAVPALAVGGLLALALILVEQHDLLFGACMCCYGLAQVAYRLSLPRGIYLLGLCYIACGAGCLIARVPLLNPWPMGITFFFGEVAGGIILLRNGGHHDEQTE
jgi:hypothetical protein